MPELPEVEVVKKSLIKKVRNLIIKSVKINDGKLRYKIEKKQTIKIVGLKIKNILRRSKFLLFFLNKDFVILAHLGMTGKFFFINKKNIKYKTSFYYDVNKTKDQKHDHIIFNLSKNQKLIYNDVRKFGFIKLLDRVNLKNNKHLKNLGPEPLSKKFNFIYFKHYILNRNRAIKDVLMDQKFVSGLGNIYVNEILFFSKIKPTRNIKDISDDEIKKILKFTKTTLIKAINLGGSSIKDFSSSSGKKGSFQQHFKVYGKKNEKCPRKNCNSFVSKIVTSNRSSFYCNKCQK